MKLVDPNGEEIYEFNESGELINISGRKCSPDQIAIYKSNGSFSMSKEYENGTIISCTTFNKENPYTEKFENANMLDIATEDAALELLSFVADNSTVEWEVGAGEDGLNNCSVVLGTLLDEKHVNSKTYLQKYRGCVNISLIAHNHPENNGSETFVSEADINNAKGQTRTTHLLYTRMLGFQKYDENGNQNGQYIDNEGRIKSTKRL